MFDFKFLLPDSNTSKKDAGVICSVSSGVTLNSFEIIGKRSLTNQCCCLFYRFTVHRVYSTLDMLVIFT